MTKIVFIDNGGWILVAAIAWISCIMVGWYVYLCVKARVRIRKPLGCQKCMAFWVGFVTFGVELGVLNGFIYGIITSLMAALISRYVNGTGI